MKILYLSSYFKKGGAGICADRLYKYFVKNNISIRRYSKSVENRLTFTNAVGIAFSKLVRKTDYLLLGRHKVNENYHYSLGKIGEPPISNIIDKYKPDIVHLHWINHGFININQISRINLPIVWTLHDSWAFTGGCHLPNSCERYVTKCGECPALNSSRQNDLSQSQFLLKYKKWKNKNIHLVTPSKWLKNKVMQSKILGNYPVRVINNGIDTSQFSQTDRNTARISLSLPLSKSIILFVAHFITGQENKGFNLFKEIAQHYLGKNDNYLFVVIGSIDNKDKVTQDNIFFAGEAQEEMMKQYYSAANCLVVTSKYENLPTTIIECLAAGTPTVAYSCGGIPEIINHKINGYLVNKYDLASFNAGLKWIGNNNSELIRLKCMERAADFSIERVADQYIDLYDEVIYKNNIELSEN